MLCKFAHNPINILSDVSVGDRVMFTADMWDWRFGLTGFVTGKNENNFQLLVKYENARSRIKEQWNKYQNLSKI